MHLGQALVGSILSERSSSAPRSTWRRRGDPEDDAAVRDKWVQLLDACFTLLRWEAPGQRARQGSGEAA